MRDKTEDLENIVDSLIKLKNVYNSETFSLEKSEELIKATRDIKKKVHKYVSATDKYIKSRTATNTTIDGKLIALARKLFDNAEISGQEGDIYLYENLMKDYHIVMKYLETKDSSLENKVNRLYSNMFRDDLNKLPKIISITGSSLKECPVNDIDSPLCYSYVTSLYRLFKSRAMEGTNEFLVDLTERTCVFIIVALEKLKNKYPNLKIYGIAESDYLDIFLPKNYLKLYTTAVKKLDEVIYLNEIDNRNNTSWYSRMQLEMYLTSSDIKECLVIKDDIGNGLKECAKENNCKITLCNINIGNTGGA